MRIAIGFLFVIFSLVIPSVASSQSVDKPKAFTPTAIHQQSLSPFLEFFDDPGGDVEISEIIGAHGRDFKPLVKPNFGFGFKGVRWLRFTIDLTDGSMPGWFLRHNYMHARNLTLYYNQGDALRVLRLSEEQAAEHRDFFVPSLIIKVPVDAKNITTYYLRVEPGGHALNTSLDWLTQKAVVEDTHNNAMISGLFFGSLIALLIYNMIICIMLRSMMYAKYAYYLFFLILAFVYLTGYAPFLLNHVTLRWEQFFAACCFVAIHGMALSGRNILNLSGKSAKVLKMFECLLLLGAILSFYLTAGLAYRILNILIIGSACCLLISSIRRSLQGYQPAYIYAAGWVAFILAIICYSLTYLGFFGLNWFTTNAVKFAAVIEAVLFSIALALRFKLGIDVASKAKNAFLGMVSHELKTPLQTIISSLDFAAISPNKPISNSNLKRLVDASKQLEVLVYDLTDFSHLESGKVDLKNSSFDLPGLAKDVINIYALIAKSKDIEIVFECPQKEFAIYGDEVRVRQVLTNLLQNAIKYSKVGPIVVRAAKFKTPKGLAFLLEVEDNGIGIAKEHVKSIYEPFVQIGTDNYSSHGGIGMGLTIVKYFVGLMGGSIEVHSALGKGSCFTVTIPLSESSDSKATDRSANQSILLVDDHEEVLATLGPVVQSLGYEVDLCSSGRSALLMARLNHYGAILLDVNMPGLSGFEVAQRIKSMHTHTNTSIVCISATKPSWWLKEQGRKFSHFLEKPIRVEQLALLLDELLLPKQKSTSLPWISNGSRILLRCRQAFMRLASRRSR